MKKIILSLLTIYCCCLSAQEFATGGVYSASKHDSVPFADILEIRRKQAPPLSTISQSHFLPTPPIGDQGTQGSCAGWAVGYAAMSILAYDKYQQNWELATMSPSFVYNQVKLYDCYYGANIVDALDLVSTKGICTISQMPYDEFSCDFIPTNIFLSTALNRVSYGKISHTSVDEIRSCIAMNLPVVVGIRTTDAFREMLNNGGIWSHNENFENSNYHFCCVVGYDDNRECFKVMNSWGPNVGDNGYFWVTYDLAEISAFQEAYVLYDMIQDTTYTLVGPDKLCYNAQYFINNVPTFADLQWIRTGIQDFNPDWIELIDSTNITLPKSTIRIHNFMSDTVTITPANNIVITSDGTFEHLPYTGPALLNPRIVYQNEVVEFSKTIIIQEKLDPEIQANISFFPDMEEDAPEHLLVGVSYYFKSALFPNENDLQWTIVMTGDTVTGVGIQSPIIIAGYDSIFVSVFNPNTDECISNSLSTKLYTTMEFIGMDFANPADDMVDIQVAHTLPSNTQARNMTLRTANIEPLLYEGECEVELWDMYRGKLRTVTGKDGYVQMPLQGVAPGNYVLRLIIDGQQVDSKPLMVR